MTATVKKIGGSVAVLIPKVIAAEMGLTAGVSLSLCQEDDAIVIRKARRRPRRPLGEIVRQIKRGSRKPIPGWDTDAPVGREIW